MVSLAESHIARNRKAVFVTRQLPQQIAAISEIAPILRGSCALPEKSEGAYPPLRH